MDSLDDETYDIAELAAVSGLTVRTIRYYIQQKLVPPSRSMGPGARYGKGHLTRLRLIRHFQRKDLSLAEIRQKLEAADLVGDPVPGSSTEYLEAVLATTSATKQHDSLEQDASRGTIALRSQWERITLTDGVEIHVRRPLNRVDNRNLERLIEAGKEIFEVGASVLHLVSTQPSDATTPDTGAPSSVA
jgi:DNA-binding transcriptional MerR regulator